MKDPSRIGTEEGKHEDMNNPRIASGEDITVPNTATEATVYPVLTLQEEISKPKLIKISNRRSTTNA